MARRQEPDFMNHRAKTMTMAVRGDVAQFAKAALAPHRFVRRDPRSNNVLIEVLYGVVCHSDIHSVRNNWQNATYPMVPDHEIIGRLVSVGSDVTRFKPSTEQPPAKAGGLV